jgi:type I restriction enzyme S subunit
MNFDQALPIGWYWSTLDEVRAQGRSVVSGPFGSNIGSRFFVASGVPVIRGSNLTTGMARFREEEFVFLTPEKAAEFKSCEAIADDLILTAAGTIGQVGLIPKISKYPKYIISNKQLRARFDVTKIDPEFAYYWFASPVMVQMIQSRNTGSTIPLINLSVLKSLPIPVPPIDEQREIASYLSAFDSRINLLRETNTTLEAIAQALFKSWFVDFDPVHAKMQGRAPEGMDEATAALFPDSFEESELGDLPKGWRIQKFGDFIDRQSVGKKFDQKTAFASGPVPILDQGKSGVIGFHNEEPGIKASLERPVVVFANHTCYMRLICFDFSAIQNVLPFIGKGVDTVWAFYATKDRVKFSEYKGHWPDFAIEKAVVPPVEFTDVFRRVVDPLTARIRNNELQIQNLAALRDTLLPRLISGQLQLESMEARDGS